MLAAYALMGQSSNLPREPSQRELGQSGTVVALDPPAKAFNPELSGAVHINVGNIGTRELAFERGKASFEIDARRGNFRGGRAHLGVPAAVKSRSCATNTLMLLPAGTVRVGT